MSIQLQQPMNVIRSWPAGRRRYGSSGFTLLEMIVVRSEEHTSELQSRLHLVCRLLLEKKKNKQDIQSFLTRPSSHLIGKKHVRKPATANSARSSSGSRTAITGRRTTSILIRPYALTP